MNLLNQVFLFEDVVWAFMLACFSAPLFFHVDHLGLLQLKSSVESLYNEGQNPYGTSFLCMTYF